MPCIVESPVASTIGRASRAAPPSPPTHLVATRSRRTRSSTRQRPRALARKRRLATVTARGKSTDRQRGRRARRDAQPRADVADAPAVDDADARVRPGLRGAARQAEACAQDGVRTL